MTPPNPVGWALPTNSLNELQRWLLTAIAKPAGIAPAQLASTILPSRHQSAADRLAIYQHAYLARLLEVLREVFPCTRFAVGDDLFNQFAAGYLAAHPPHNYSLAHLADHWVEYLDASRPSDWGRFVIELARLEHAIDRIFDEPGPESLPPFSLPTNPTDSLRLTLVPGLELLAFDFPTSSFYTVWKQGQQPAWPNERQQFVALLRRDYIVRRFELTQAQFQVLLELQRGATLGETLLAATQPAEIDTEDMAANVGQWFQFWAAEQFYAKAV
jgi:hypothetical protein